MGRFEQVRRQQKQDWVDDAVRSEITDEEDVQAQVTALTDLCVHLADRVLAKPHLRWHAPWLPADSTTLRRVLVDPKLLYMCQTAVRNGGHAAGPFLPPGPVEKAVQVGEVQVP